MPANVEWEIPFEILVDAADPSGTTFQFNTALGSGDRYLLDPKKCSCGVALRVTSDPIPQADGAIFHRRYRHGYVMNLAVEFWDDEVQACDTKLREMNDTLMGVLNDLLNAENARILWTPSGYSDDRMLDRIQLGPADVAATLEQPGGFTVVTFSVDTPFPYAIDKTEIDTTILDGATATITNAGSVMQWAVMRVSNADANWSVTNMSVVDDLGNPLAMVYNDALPDAPSISGGNYGEFDHFKNAAYLNGNSSNLKPGIVMTSSDFFPLVRGPNVIQPVGCDVLVLSNNAWA